MSIVKKKSAPTFVASAGSPVFGLPANPNRVLSAFEAADAARVEHQERMMLKAAIDARALALRASHPLIHVEDAPAEVTGSGVRSKRPRINLEPKRMHFYSRA